VRTCTILRFAVVLSAVLAGLLAFVGAVEQAVRLGALSIALHTTLDLQRRVSLGCCSNSEAFSRVVLACACFGVAQLS
jgi:hypothetical protein